MSKEAQALRRALSLSVFYNQRGDADSASKFMEDAKWAAGRLISGEYWTPRLHRNQFSNTLI